MLSKEIRDRLRSAGDRYRVAEQERLRALRELKAVMAEADGDSSPEEAAGLTGLDGSTSAIFLGHE